MTAGIGIIVIGSMILLLWFAGEAAKGIRQGLSAACELLVPSLLPFMVLSSFLIRSGLSDYFGRCCGRMTRHWFRLPPETAGTILLSFIGGFPVGAKCVRLLYEQRKITAAQAEQMMLFCVGAGPAFVITGIGTLLLHSPQAGVILFVSQILSGVLLGRIAGRLSGCRAKNIPHKSGTVSGDISYINAFLASCTDGANALIQMTVLVALFAMLSAVNEAVGLCEGIRILLQACGVEYPFANHAYYILTEVTIACQRIGDGGCPLWMLAFAIGLGGLCVHCQILALLGDLPMSKAKYFLFRVMNASLSAGIVYIVCQFYQPTAVTAAVIGDVQIEWGAATAVGSMALMAVSVLFVLSVKNAKREVWR